MLLIGDRGCECGEVEAKRMCSESPAGYRQGRLPESGARAGDWKWEVWKNGRVGSRVDLSGLQRKGREAGGGRGQWPWIWAVST